MAAQKGSKQQLSQHWTKLLASRLRSGKTVKHWCAEQGIKESTYYYWRRRLNERNQKMESQNTRDKVPSTKVVFHATAPKAIIPEETAPISLFKEVRIAEPSPPGLSPETEHDSRLEIELKGIRLTARKDYPVASLALLLQALVR